MANKKIDKIFLLIVIILVAIGVVLFTSASLGILARNESKFYNVILNQFIFGLIGGMVALFIGYKVPYQFWRKYALYVFLLSIIITLLVFIPGVGSMHGGARRWINVFGISLQPVEFLKIGFIIYYSALISWAKNRIQYFQYSIVPLILLIGIISGVLINQPDTKSIILIVITSLSMVFAAGVRLKYILLLFIISIIALGVLVMLKPYLMDRVQTFLHPSRDNKGSSYQLQQSLIAIGGGGIWGRGLGQSIQKFNYLPEPQGDSIFAVLGEELGLIGCSIVILLFVIFFMRGYRIAYNAPDSFSKIFIIGSVTMITAQSFMNMASIIGVFPLTGVPLVFISHGGTSLLLSLAQVGIILHISQYQKVALKNS